MAGEIVTMIQALKTLLADVNDGATPTHNHYFDHIWIGQPKKIPLGDKNIAIIEVASQPNYYYTTCAAQTQFDVDIIISIMCKGHVDVATLRAYEIIEAVQTALFNNQKITNTCLGSTVESVDYGDFWEQEKNLVTGARITLRCRL